MAELLVAWFEDMVLEALWVSVVLEALVFWGASVALEALGAETCDDLSDYPPKIRVLLLQRGPVFLEVLKTIGCQPWTSLSAVNHLLISDLEWQLVEAELQRIFHEMKLATAKETTQADVSTLRT